MNFSHNQIIPNTVFDAIATVPFCPLLLNSHRIPLQKKSTKFSKFQRKFIWTTQKCVLKKCAHKHNTHTHTHTNLHLHKQNLVGYTMRDIRYKWNEGILLYLLFCYVYKWIKSKPLNWIMLIPSAQTLILKSDFEIFFSSIVSFFLKKKNIWISHEFKWIFLH